MSFPMCYCCCYPKVPHLTILQERTLSQLPLNWIQRQTAPTNDSASQMPCPPTYLLLSSIGCRQTSPLPIWTWCRSMHQHSHGHLLSPLLFLLLGSPLLSISWH